MRRARTRTQSRIRRRPAPVRPKADQRPSRSPRSRHRRPRRLPPPRRRRPSRPRRRDDRALPALGPAEPIPLTVLTGFLGAGKTSLLKRLVADPPLAETAVIINEFREIRLG